MAAVLEPLGQWRRSRRLLRPKALECITMLEPNGGLSAEEIWRAMSVSECWNPGLDPRSPRVLAVGGTWVFKANLSKRTLDRRKAETELREMIRLTSRLGVWHPGKTWFLFRDRRRYIPCSATPLMPLLNTIAWPSRGRAAFQLLRLMTAALRGGFTLDLQIRNFGIDPTSRRLYYIDDEVYRTPWLRKRVVRAEVKFDSHQYSM